MSPETNELTQETTDETISVDIVTDGDVLDTPEIDMPIPDPEAHRGVIEAVTEETFETGSVGIKLSLKSIDMGFNTDYTIFPPMEFVENASELFAGTMTPADLSSEVPAGKKQSPRQRYGAVVSNTDGDAELQKLRRFAKEDGRAASGRPTSFTEFVERLGELLNGLEIVFTRKADVNNENVAFRRSLKVNGIYSKSITNDPKALKNYVKMWNR